MKFTDSLTIKDVETIAKGRVSRAESQKTNLATVAMVLCMGVGLLLLNTNRMVGIILFLLGAGIFFWYTNGLGKKQKNAQRQAVLEWQQEQADKRDEDAIPAGATK